MPVPFLTSIDLNRNEILNGRLQNLGTDPTGLVAGDKGLLWIDAAGVIKYWDGATTKELGLATGGNAETLDGQDGIWYLDRANHTGTQVSTTISDLTEAVQDIVGAALGDTATVNVTYDDVAGTVTFAVLDSPTVGGATPAQLRDRGTHTGTQTASTISDLAEAVDDRVSTLAVGGTHLNVVYDDVANTLTFNVDDTAIDAATIDGIDSTALEKTANKGVANGYASLGADAKVPSAQLPALALTDVSVVATIVARDALTVQEGDVAIVTGTAQTFIYDGTAWQEMVSPTDGVTSVTGTAPIVSSGGTTPAISITAATTAAAGSMSAADKTKLDGVESGATADQTATEVPITDAGGHFTATHVEGALQELGAASNSVTKVTQNIGDGVATTFTITHNLGTRDVQATVYRNVSPWDTVYVDVERDTINSVVLRFASAPATGAFRVVII